MARQKKVQVWLYRRSPAGVEYLLLKRPRDWHSGEFWQPLTGNVEPGEAPPDCARRELAEELRLTGFSRVIDPGLVCRFEKNGRRFSEFVFGFEAGEAEVQLSHEHEACAWVDFETALRKLRFATNAAGLGAIDALLKAPALEA